MSTTLKAEGLLSRIARGDRSAFHDCLRRHGALVNGIAARFFAAVQDREDVVQDVFLTLWRDAGRYDESFGPEEAFIAVIARRRVIDLLRKRGRRLESDGASDALDEVAASTSELTDRLEQGDEVARVRAAMRELRPEEQQVIELAVLQGLSQAQVAERLGLPLGTVKSLARRGLMRLRERVVTIESSSATAKEVSFPAGRGGRT